MALLKEDPIEVRLGELPEDGRDFRYDDQHPAMAAALKDVVEKNSFKIQVFIRPVGNMFEMTGCAETALNLACYRCALDFTVSSGES